MLCLGLTACASLLPQGATDQPSGFASFDAARLALEQVVPFRTTLAELTLLGFDPYAGNNVTLIPYPAIVTRLAPYPGVPLEALDPGVRECIAAQSACRAYAFQLGEQSRRREGSFWLDFMNFKRTTYVTGWRFDGLVVMRGDVVLFRNFGGEARIDRVERQLNPLGPLQGAGDQIGNRLLN
ncbi:MAG: hypothetical protein Q8L49_18045 [Burkholderiaceae bacterium]|nr:hypothetical protein [Burkholderiaceae bacterium]